MENNKKNTCPWTDTQEGQFSLLKHLLDHFSVKEIKDICFIPEDKRVVHSRCREIVQFTHTLECSIEDFTNGELATRKRVSIQQLDGYHAAVQKLLEKHPNLDLENIVIHGIIGVEERNDLAVPIGVRVHNALPRTSRVSDGYAYYDGFSHVIPARTPQSMLCGGPAVILRATDAPSYENRHSRILTDSIGTTRAEQLWNGIIRLPSLEDQDCSCFSWCIIPRRHLLESKACTDMVQYYGAQKLVLDPDDASITHDRPHGWIVSQAIVEKYINDAGKRLYPFLDKHSLSEVEIEMKPFDTSEKVGDLQQLAEECAKLVMGDDDDANNNNMDTTDSQKNIDVQKKGKISFTFQLSFAAFPKDLSQREDVICTYEPNDGRINDAELEPEFYREDDNDSNAENTKRKISSSSKRRKRRGDDGDEA